MAACLNMAVFLFTGVTGGAVFILVTGAGVVLGFGVERILFPKSKDLGMVE